MILLIILYMLFASTFTIGKAALAYTTPMLLISMRMLAGGTLLLGYFYFFHRNSIRFNRKDTDLLLRIAFFQYFAAFILEFIALQWMSSGKASLLWNFSPFITAVISYIVLGEKISAKKTTGLMIGFLGLLPIVYAAAPEEDIVGNLLHISLPELLVLTAVACAGYGWILFGKAQKAGYNTIFINGSTMLLAGIGALFSSFLFEGYPHIIPPTSCLSRDIPSLCALFGIYGASIALFFFYALALTVISNIICFNLYGYLLRSYSVTFMSFAGFMTPLFAAVYGRIFLNEQVGPSFVYSFLIVLVGLLIFFQEELKNTEK